ncbi:MULTISPECIES: hypothetical protein [Vibrio]|uniref:hypothetical protein n=1 Tax=Vibrio TaxID=662 RepID=UPI000374974C|nr:MULTISPECIES: hypothetical protein [Vibrio]MBT2924116.1 hypothetical protein [Vibrio anguillarum]UXH29508.1 hypothetical protein N5E84_06655 [Vibrio sp. J502]
MDKPTQSRNKNFKNRASLTRSKTHLSYKERVAKRAKSKGITAEHLSNSDYFVTLS